MSGGATAYAGNAKISAPKATSQPFILAADLGFSGGLFISNARGPSALVGNDPQIDWQFSYGIVGIDISYIRSGSTYFATAGVCVFTCIGGGVSRYNVRTVKGAP